MHVCKYKSIFKTTCSPKYYHIQFAYACFHFKYKSLKLSSISFKNLTILVATSDIKDRLVNTGLLYFYSIGYWLGGSRRSGN